MAISVLKRWTTVMGSVRTTPPASAAETFDRGDGTPETNTYDLTSPRQSGVLYKESIYISKLQADASGTVYSNLNSTLCASIWPVAANNNTNVRMCATNSKNKVSINVSNNKQIDIETMQTAVADQLTYLIEVWGF